MRILIVEDDDSIREFVSTFLLDEGHEIVQAANGIEALKVVEHQPPALILLDVYMPRMDGPSFVAAYRQTRPDTAPIIGMSANAHEARMLDCFDGFIAKPFDLTELLDCVDQFAAKA